MKDEAMHSLVYAPKFTFNCTEYTGSEPQILMVHCLTGRNADWHMVLYCTCFKCDDGNDGDDSEDNKSYR